MRKSLITFLMMPALIIAAPAMANTEHQSKGKAHHGDVKKQAKPANHPSHQNRGIFNDLDLTDAQKEQINALRESYRAENREQNKASWALRKSYKQLSYQNEIDQVELNKVIDSSVAHQSQQLKNRAALNSAIFNVLTPEQQQKITQKWAERAEKKSVN